MQESDRSLSTLEAESPFVKIQRRHQPTVLQQALLYQSSLHFSNNEIFENAQYTAAKI